MKHPSFFQTLAALALLLASSVSAAQFRLRIEFPANDDSAPVKLYNYITCGLDKNELLTPYPQFAPGSGTRIYFTAGSDANDPDAQDFQNLATCVRTAAPARTWTIVVDSAPDNGTELAFSLTSGNIPQGAMLRISDIHSTENFADITEQTRFTVHKDHRYALQFAEAGRQPIPPAPQNQNLVILDTPNASCFFEPELPADPSYAVITDASAVAFRTTPKGYLEIAADNVGTVTYDDATNRCTFTLPEEIAPDWDEIHVNFRFSDGVNATEDAIAFIQLVEDPTPRLQFKPGTDADKLIPENPQDISINSLKFDVLSNESWTVSKPMDADWLTLTTTRGQGNAPIYFSVSQLLSEEQPSRTAAITVTSKSGLTLNASVTQTFWPKDVRQTMQRTPLNTIDLNLDMPLDTTFSIVADASATAYAQDDSGNTHVVQENVGSVLVDNVTKTFTYTLPDSLGQDWHQLQFTYAFSNGLLTTDEASVVITLTEPPFLRFKQGTVTPKSIPADVADIPENELMFQIESNEDWTVTLKNPSNWLTLKTTSASQNATVFFNVASNLNRGASRSNDFTILSASGKSLTYTVIQQPGQAPAFSISPEAADVPGFANDVSVNVNANIDWAISTAELPEWLTFSQTAGSGSRSVIVHIAPNPSGEPRSADVMFISENLTSPLTAVCTVTQTGTISSTLPQLYPGWNLIALDAVPADSAELLQDVTAAFTMTTASPVSALEPGIPYWLYAEKEQPQRAFKAYALPDNWRQRIYTCEKWRAIGVAKPMETPKTQAIWTWDAAHQRFVPQSSFSPKQAYWFLP